MVAGTDVIADSVATEHERDLALFIGRNAGRFERAWREISLRRLPVTWSWPGFLVPVPWLFYRKMYLAAFSYVATIVILGLAAPDVAGRLAAAFSILIAVLGKSLYVYHARRRIRRADARGLSGAARDDYLRRAGGVSPAAAIFGTLFTLSGIVLTVVSVVLGGP